MDLDFTLSWHAPNSFRAQSIIGTYDLKDVKLEKRIRCSLPIEGDWWQVGVIVGKSGSGKSSVAMQIPETQYFKGKAVYVDFKYCAPDFPDDFPANLTVKEVGEALCSSGFAEPPAWLKSYSCLSTGQKMRVDIARALCLPEKLVIFDEFTSVVDREVAKISAFAISRNVRRHVGRQFIAVTCHFDVVDWLEPDWTYNMDTGEFVKKNDVTQQLSSRFISAIYPCGKSFGSIII